MTDWKLIQQAMISINWIKTINDLENADKTLRQLITEKKENLHVEGERILNVGFLIMATYMFFVYPKESELDTIDYSKIDTSKFIITNEESDNRNPKVLCRRLRNSISHARFEVIHEMNLIKFHDEHTSGSNKIDFEIGIVDFGEFIDNFILEVNSQVLTRTGIQ